MLTECMTFAYDENGRPDAQEGKHDDQLFSDMIANEIRPQQSFNVIVEQPPKRKTLIEQLGLQKKTEVSRW